MIREFELPWPPSVNHYYRHVGPRVLISKDGRQYREAIVSRFRSESVTPFPGPVDLTMDAYPPDNRRRDLDNLLKCLLDSFTYGGLYRDDSQVQKLTITKRETMPPGGKVFIKIKDYENETECRRNVPDRAELPAHDSG